MLYFKKLKQFSLRIGSNKTIGRHISIKLINLFSKRYSYSNTQLKFGCSKSISWGLMNGKIDIGFIQDNEVPKILYNSLYIKSYFQEKLALIVPQSYEETFIGVYAITVTEGWLNFFSYIPRFLHFL